MITLVEKDVKTRNDLADLSSDELVEIIGSNFLEQKKADEIIIDARKHWFDWVLNLWKKK